MAKHYIENEIEDHDLLTRIDQKVETLTKDICDIKENHLPHIYSRLNKIETRIAYYAGGIVVGSAIINYLLK